MLKEARDSLLAVIIVSESVSNEVNMMRMNASENHRNMRWL